MVAVDVVSTFLGTPSVDDVVGLIGASLFADGAAAIYLDDVHPGNGLCLEVLATDVVVVPETEHMAVLDLESRPVRIVMDRGLGDLVKTLAPDLVDAFLAAESLTRADVDRWVIHPGGRTIIEGARTALGLSVDDVLASTETLRDHGNMGTPTSFFALKRSLENRPLVAGERVVMLTVGPGITVGLALLKAS